MTTKRSFEKRITAAALVLAVQFLLMSPAHSEVTSKVTGTVAAAEAGHAVTGARLHFADKATGKLYSSEPVGTDGGFLLGDLPAATYEVAVELDGGLYLAKANLLLGAGESRELHLVLPHIASPQGATPVTERRGVAGIWDNPLTAALVVVGAAIGVGLIVTAADDSDEASPFAQ